ncbi:MAG: hypothetical protein IIA87_05285 [Nanoarchaeota archaeon]|nr:hypothetical protein [Nanoarchaeota archaeon]
MDTHKRPIGYRIGQYIDGRIPVWAIVDVKDPVCLTRAVFSGDSNEAYDAFFHLAPRELLQNLNGRGALDVSGFTRGLSENLDFKIILNASESIDVDMSPRYRVVVDTRDNLPMVLADYSKRVPMSLESRKIIKKLEGRGLIVSRSPDRNPNRKPRRFSFGGKV